MSDLTAVKGAARRALDDDSLLSATSSPGICSEITGLRRVELNRSVLPNGPLARLTWLVRPTWLVRATWMR